MLKMPCVRDRVSLQRGGNALTAHLLHLSTIPRASDHSNLLLYVKRHKNVGLQALLLPLRVADLAGVYDGEVRVKERFQFLASGRFRGSKKHVVDKMSLPRQLGNEPDPLSGLWTRASITIKNIYL